MNYKKLGVNIDHAATLRNVRNEDSPNIVKIASLVQKSGADSITIHLREDRRHIRDNDLSNLVKKIKIPINLEIAATKKMLNIALKNRPRSVCIVPEKRSEITTEGGLNLKRNTKKIKKIIKVLQSKRIQVSLFIEPKISIIKLAHQMKANSIEIHTGSFCRLVNSNKDYNSSFLNIKKCAKYGKKIGLNVHAGHGLNYKSTRLISKINDISEFNIGHFIISDSLNLGLKKVIKKFKSIIKN
tara:strand:+ start:5662 stop:6387 length:726 start_codon:yes stop_codon:yes gene_type:complete